MALGTRPSGARTPVALGRAERGLQRSSTRILSEKHIPFDTTFFLTRAVGIVQLSSKIRDMPRRRTRSADRRGRRVAVHGFATLCAAPGRRLVTQGSAEMARGGPRRRRGAARCPRSFSLHGRRRSSCTTADACAAAGAARTVFLGPEDAPERSEAARRRRWRRLLLLLPGPPSQLPSAGEPCPVVGPLLPRASDSPATARAHLHTESTNPHSRTALP